MLYQANKTMQLIGKQTIGTYFTEENDAEQGYIDIMKAHQENHTTSASEIAMDMYIYGAITGKREARKKSQAKYKRIIAEYEKATIMSNEQICDLATTWKAPSDLIDTVFRHLEDAEAEEPQKAQELTQADRLQYLIEEAYKTGIATAMYMLNETYKEAIAELKAEI